MKRNYFDQQLIHSFIHFVFRPRNSILFFYVLFFLRFIFLSFCLVCSSVYPSSLSVCVCMYSFFSLSSYPYFLPLFLLKSLYTYFLISHFLPPFSSTSPHPQPSPSLPFSFNYPPSLPCLHISLSSYHYLPLKTSLVLVLPLPPPSLPRHTGCTCCVSWPIQRRRLPYWAAVLRWNLQVVLHTWGKGGGCRLQFTC